MQTNKTVLDGLASIYGDADPTPARNVLGSYWRARYGNAGGSSSASSSSASSDFDDAQTQCGVVEAVRGGAGDGGDGDALAWQLRVFGRPCPEGETCGLDNADPSGGGWMMCVPRVSWGVGGGECRSSSERGRAPTASPSSPRRRRWICVCVCVVPSRS